MAWEPREPSGTSGPWGRRIRIGRGGEAYRPGQLIVPTEQYEANPELFRALGDVTAEVGSYTHITGAFDAAHEIAQLRDEGLQASHNHVLFATGHDCGCGHASAPCPPHPSTPGASDYYDSLRAQMDPGSDWHRCGGSAANPFYANPFYANPFYANPFYANPFYANPFYANAEPNPALSPSGAGGRRRTSARPALQPETSRALPEEPMADPGDIRIAIVDTGYAIDDPIAPNGIMANATITGPRHDIPTDDGDGYYDPAAGHGTFIAGIIEQHAPGCQIEVVDVLSTYGDGDEATIAQALLGLVESNVSFVNLSFSGYSHNGIPALEEAIAALRAVGTVVVASAGNDATCRAPFPAVIDGVIAVGALTEDGLPAQFTNYGPWVDASAHGVDVESAFFRWDGGEEPCCGQDPDNFEGGARWSGTSFSAPRVVGELARHMVVEGGTGEDAAAALITGGGERIPMLGTVVGFDENA